ncbi:MAG: 16S rRNA (uracil(1498)-N(3))-methyltransferase [Candidatus Taylorbacteria bacterium]|nr:16S rRNA (uracil(1498)-N(3))-methyltransferase [Candidatus Taylorbacteria bacterium]
MRLHRFFVEEHIAPDIRLAIKDAKLLHQWRNVLRLKAGNEVILFDGFGMDHRCELASLDRGEAMCIVRESSKSAPPSTQQFFLFASLIKKERFEWLLEKATELGVAQIRPVIADRSEVKKFNLERAKDIVKEASEQSGRGSLPALYKPMELQNVFKEYTYFKTMAFDPHGELFKKDGWSKEEKVGAFIGPEGGWSARELELFRQEKIPVYSLGVSTLRAETAAVAVTSLLLLPS